MTLKLEPSPHRYRALEVIQKAKSYPEYFKLINAYRKYRGKGRWQSYASQ